MTDLKIFIDEVHPFQDATFPLVIQILYKKQEWSIRTPYRFVCDPSCNIEQNGIHYRSMSVVESTQEEVLKYVTEALVHIKQVIAQLEIDGENNFLESY
jgi:hypothetical protein